MLPGKSAVPPVRGKKAGEATCDADNKMKKKPAQQSAWEVLVGERGGVASILDTIAARAGDGLLYPLQREATAVGSTLRIIQEPSRQKIPAQKTMHGQGGARLAVVALRHFAASNEVT